jgi:TonB family protein
MMDLRPIFFVLFTLFSGGLKAQTFVVPDTAGQAARFKATLQRISPTPEQMAEYPGYREPRFPGCEAVADSSARYDCAAENLSRFVRLYARYPQQAAAHGVEGVAIIRIKADERGNVAPIEIVQDPGYGLGEEAWRIIEGMERMHLRWSAQDARLRPLNTIFELSIPFQLDGSIQIEE